MLPRLALVLGILIVIAAVFSVGNETKNEVRQPNNMIKLVPPPLIVARAQTTDVAFPENEAGISAYLHPTTNIDLTLAKSAFTTVDEETSGYIKGTVAVAGMTEDEYPYVWVSSDGWIIAYIPRDYKSEALIAPFGYNYPTTTLAEAIKKVCDAIGASFDYNQVGYYHFKFPDANGMVVAFEEKQGYGTDEFFVYVPKEVTIYNVSWVFQSTGNNNWAKLDGQIFARGYANPHKKTGYFEQFEKGVDHKLEIYSYYSSASTKLGLVVIYKQP